MKKQMMQQIKHIFLAVIAMVVICLMLSFVVNHNVQIRYQQYVYRSRQFQELLTLIDSEIRQMDNIYYNNDEESLRLFNENAIRIDEITDVMYDKTQPDSIRLYTRIIKWMMQDQVEYVLQISEKEAQGELDFNQFNEMKTRGKTVSNVAQQLFIEYTAIREQQYESLLKNSGTVTTVLEIVQFLILCLCLISGILIIKASVSQLKVVSDTAVKLSRKEWNVSDIPTLKYDELDQVGKAFNRMKQEITEYIDTLKEKAKIENRLNALMLQEETQQRMLKEARLLALQMQINPHFLFNTFSLISRLITAGQPQKAIRVINAISKILRYSLDNQRKMVFISEELDCIREYILIQQIRFADKVDFIMEISCDVSQAKMPAFILQPIVENAVIHGMREITDGGIIYIRVEHQAGFYCFEILDNGPGFCETGGSQEKSKGIGLVNIQERLRLQYQRDDLLAVESRPNEGAHVLIRIPETLSRENEPND